MTTLKKPRFTPDAQAGAQSMVVISADSRFIKLMHVPSAAVTKVHLTLVLGIQIPPWIKGIGRSPLHPSLDPGGAVHPSWRSNAHQHLARGMRVSHSQNTQLPHPQLSVPMANTALNAGAQHRSLTLHAVPGLSKQCLQEPRNGLQPPFTRVLE